MKNARGHSPNWQQHLSSKTCAQTASAGNNILIWKNVLDRNVSLFEYNDFLKEILSRYKFRGDYALAYAFAQHISIELKSIEFDYLTTIPLSKERLLERGFNQSTGLLHAAGFHQTEFLKRLHSEKQSKKSRHDRIHRTDVFQIESNTTSLSEKTILLIDDIYTTGSTLRHAAKALKDAGASRIIAFTLARG